MIEETRPTTGKSSPVAAIFRARNSGLAKLTLCFLAFFVTLHVIIGKEIWVPIVSCSMFIVAFIYHATRCGDIADISPFNGTVGECRKNFGHCGDHKHKSLDSGYLP